MRDKRWPLLLVLVCLGAGSPGYVRYRQAMDELDLGARKQALTAFIKSEGARSGYDLQALAYLGLGGAALTGNCPKVLHDGLCAELVTLPAASRCPGHTSRLVALRRDAAGVDAARQAYDQAFAIVQAGARVPAGVDASEQRLREGELAEASARARLELADLATEELLALESPRMKGDSKVQRMRIKSYVETFMKKLATAKGLYEALVASQPPATWLVAAMDHEALLYRAAAMQLLSLQIPAGLAKADVRDAYCDAMEEQAAGFAEAARDAFKACAEKAVQLGVSSREASHCAAQP